ncbi:MAG TPA: molybdenum cofactor biosynthesis protein MoaE [Vicinamibacterales bacterium]|nr:molybdenum cofactor biosynthesis protein MoaE [Vicinamibacterales bacterium]HOQ60961.1 molybdenum cofactor biosynthesis protein MoaE [Vicinamibacterales bacterium]HPW19726.1 molybdenum cofactor biosynthesis protein MoaE [Vicinamibacterales bacterium]
MPDALLSLTPEPLDATALVRLLDDASAPGEHGAVTAFVGMVRAENLGRRVIALDYEAYEPLALEAFRLIAEEAAAAWPGVRLAIRQRVGRVGVGDASIVIAAASAHRAEAFAACRYAIERVKQVAPIWKRELFAGGACWLEGRTADPFDAAARDAAMRRACG